MITEVVVKRELFGCQIGQKSKSEFLCATDLERAGNAWRVTQGMGLFRMKDWLNLKSTKELIGMLEARYGKVLISGRGRGYKTWMHPFLFIDMSLAISPKLKIEVYEWLYDHLLRYRNESGDSYKKMSGALFNAYGNKSEFPKFIQITARRIRLSCGIDDWNETDEVKLKLRDKIHENIALLSDLLPVEDAIRIGIKKALDETAKVR